MQRELPVVVLVGRPNVGKSTLFNRLTRTRDALVADQPGVTRDRLYGFVAADGCRFMLVDTGGLGIDDADIDALAQTQTDVALGHADAVCLVVDGTAGLLPGDSAIAAGLRRGNVPVFVAVNKTEGQPADDVVAEFHALGLGVPHAISASHGHRIAALSTALVAALPPPAQAPAPTASGMRIAVLGRPNAGKSTLVNRLLGEQRVLTRDEPGTTRDAVAVVGVVAGEPLVLVDTAGVRPRARVQDLLEKFSAIKAMQAAAAADVVIILIDAQRGAAAQDVRLLAQVAAAGRGMVVAVNKWDGLSSEQREHVRDSLDERLVHLPHVPRFFVSARHGSGLGELLAAVRRVYAATTIDLSTSALTRALSAAVAAHAPPAVQGRRIKLRYAHQGGRQPPRIVIHGNRTEQLPPAYRRYLERRFRAAFALQGAAVELIFRTGDNPYDD